MTCGSSPIQAAKLRQVPGTDDLFWLEGCTPAENQDALRVVCQHTTTPLAIGEVCNTVWDYLTLIKDQLIDSCALPSPMPAGSSRLSAVQPPA